MPSNESPSTSPTRRSFLQGALAAAAAVGATSPSTASAANAAQAPKDGKKRPNLIFILGEGQRADAMSISGNSLLKTPNHDRIGREGIRFQNAFCTNALCGPARSSVLTGMYSKSTGALDNKNLELPLDVPYFTDMLQQAGYEIAMVGKAHCRAGAADRPWDYYFAFNAPSTDYYAGKFREGRHGRVGPAQAYQGFADDVALDHAMKWLDEPRDKPFCLLFWPQTPHAPFYRERRHLNLYNGVPIPIPSTFDDDLKGYPGKSSAFRDAKNKIGTFQNGDSVRTVEELVKDYYAGLVAVDDMIGRIFTWLEERQILDDTAIVHSSDHGFFLGEYRCYDKRLMHEPAIRIPMQIRYPKVFKAGTVKDEMVLDLDIAPTILGLAGIEPRKEMQGHSMLPFAEAGPKDWRREWFYDYYEYPGAEEVRPHRGVRTETKKLMHFYTIDEWEMYDVANDPEEKHNLYGKPEHAGLQQDLTNRLERLAASVPQRAG